MEAWCEGMMDQGEDREGFCPSDEDLRVKVAEKVKKAREEYEEEEDDPTWIRKELKRAGGRGKLILIEDERPGFFE